MLGICYNSINPLSMATMPSSFYEILWLKKIYITLKWNLETFFISQNILNEFNCGCKILNEDKIFKQR